MCLFYKLSQKLTIAFRYYNEDESWVGYMGYDRDTMSLNSNQTVLSSNPDFVKLYDLEEAP